MSAVGGDPEDQARATLADMQSRLAAGPYATLAIAANSTEAEARTAFLALTKVYHPARFSRMAADLQRQSNEIFLGIKSNYEALAKTSGWATRGEPKHAQAPAVAAAPSRPPSPGPGVARGTGARPVQPVQPVGAQPTQPMGSLPAQRAPAAAARPGTPPIAGRPPSPGPTPARPASPVAAATGARPTTPSPAPGARPTTPSPAPGAAARPAPPQTVQPWKASPSGATRAASPIPTATGTGSGARPPAGAFDERAELMVVMDLVRKGQWPAARQALQNLAARVPGSTNYKALLAYARAREAQQANRPDEAILELQRALQLDPNLSLAKTALAELQARKK